MDNQHKKIKGYRDLSQEEIDQMNKVKELGISIGQLVDGLKNKTIFPDDKSFPDQRWVSIGATDLQKGLMALTRSIAKPEFF